MFLAVTQTQRRVSRKLLSSMSQKDVVSRYIFHQIPVRKSHCRLEFELVEVLHRAFDPDLPLPQVRLQPFLPKITFTCFLFVLFVWIVFTDFSNKATKAPCFRLGKDWFQLHFHKQNWFLLLL